MQRGGRRDDAAEHDRRRRHLRSGEALAEDRDDDRDGDGDIRRDDRCDDRDGAERECTVQRGDRDHAEGTERDRVRHLARLERRPPAEERERDREREEARRLHAECGADRADRPRAEPGRVVGEAPDDRGADAEKERFQMLARRRARAARS